MFKWLRIKFSKKVVRFEDQFPLKATITQDIIDRAINHVYGCVGALTLGTVLKNGTPLWGAERGAYQVGDKCYSIGTIEDVNMMRVRTPQVVNFILIPNL